MKSYKIYALGNCPYCEKLIQFLIDRKITFYVEFLDGNKKKLKEMKIKYEQPTVPIVIQVTTSERFIGGCDNTLKLIREGEIDE